ncbi:MAG: hypothetical protein JWL59_3772 [Chthoniobacteraceae bacterium]|nr:hypothetical protein [Chthoniobacteraceae bacterium]
MKRILLTSYSVLAVLVTSLGAAPAKVSLTTPTFTIGPVHRRLIKVNVPPGFDSVTLEVCTNLKRAEWKPVGTKATASLASVVEFKLERAVSRRFLRVNAKATAPVAEDIQTGPSIFLADPAAVANGAFASGNALLSSNSFAADSKSGGEEARTVSESDIWRVSGDRLYFYNELRGLQVFDISEPDSPALLGQLRANGYGDQMYLLDAGHVALLTHSPSGLDVDSSSLILADVSTGRPKKIGNATYPGWLRESRLVGKVLYVVSESYYNSGAALQVTSFDLSDPAHPIKRDTLSLGGYGGVITATDRFLFVTRYSETDWDHSLVDIIDITSPIGAIKKTGTIATAGIVNDKFKMQLKGDTFTVVSAISRRTVWENGGNITVRNSKTAVETFSLKNPAAPVALGNINLGIGESVRATRFDGNRLYVVTFFSIDPLWVVDLSIPKSPALLGELEVPGFSSYIEPLGDRLVAIGNVNGRVAVSLFDVSDPAHPASLSQIPLGDGSYSYSEANWNEKAVNVVPEENLIVVPYSGYDANSGYASRVQLIDLNRDALTKRGIIEHPFAARRTAVVGDRLLAISSSNLVTVDFLDRDKPKVTSDVEIAWHVDRVFLADNYLVELGNATGWNPGSQPTITVTTASAPDGSLNVIDLDKIPVIGSAMRDGRLYIAQQNTRSYYNGYITLLTTTATAGVTLAPDDFTVSVYDLTKLPAVTLLGKTTTKVGFNLNYGAQLKAVWPAPGILVWMRPQDSWNYWWGGIVYNNFSSNLGVANSSLLTSAADTSLSNASAFASNNTIIAGSLILPAIRWYPYYQGDQGGTEAAVFDVSSPNTPVFASTFDLRTGATTDWSDPFVSDGKLYVSSMAYSNAEVVDPKLNSTDLTVTPRAGRQFMRVVGFDGPKKPLIGPEINIPGRLIGVPRLGTMLLTSGPLYTDTLKPSGDRAIHASKFDGAAAHFISQIPLPLSNGGYAVDGETTLVNLPGQTTPAAKPSIQAWTIDGNGKFQLASTTETDSYGNLVTLHGLALLGWGPAQHLYDVTDPGKLIDLGFFTSAGSYSATVENSDANPARGLWEASGDYGVSFIEFGK